MTDSAVVSVAGLAIAAMIWFAVQGQLRDANRIAIVAVLASIACVANIVIPLPNVELTTPIIILVTLTLGMPTAITVAVVATLAGDLIGGIGIWTAWQIVGFTITTCIARACGAAISDGARRPIDTPLLLIITAFATIVFDLVTTLGGLYSAAAIPDGKVGSVLLLGLPYTVVHVTGTCVAMLIVGKPLLQLLWRAQRRLSTNSQHYDVARGR